MNQLMESTKTFRNVIHFLDLCPDFIPEKGSFYRIFISKNKEDDLNPDFG